MKSLILLRHGKSDRDESHETDHERPLARRGKKASILAGRFLASLGQPPDHVLSSSAERALATAKLATESGRWRCPLEATGQLYETNSTGVLRLLRGLDDDIRTLLLVGHEPTWSDLAGRLVGRAAIRFPTAAMVRIEFDTDTWASIKFGGGTLIWMVTPRMLSRARRGVKSR